ncbi:ABC transporter transmembrane domain-containing protein [Rickettsiaceae bacterium]|nr:ABC transporter transmembrane domain-containing protein [Rickettsiaceae bacterium]
MNLIDKYKLDDPVCNFRLNKSELIISTLAVNLLSLALPIMVLQVYDRIMTNHSVGTLSVLAIGVCIAVLFEAILRIARSYTTGWTGMIYEYTMSANAMRYYINSDPSKLKEEGAGKQIQNLGAFSKLRDFYSGQTLVTLVDIPFAFIFLMLISYLTGDLVFVPLTLIIVFTAITWFVGNRLMGALKNQDANDDKRYNFIIETLQGIHSIKSYGIESVFKRRYERLEEDSTISNYETSLISTEGYTFGVLFNEIMVISVVTFGAPMVIAGELTTGALIATVLLSGRLMQPIQKALFLWTQFQDYRLASGKAEDMFSINQMHRTRKDKSKKKIGTIELKNLGFGYGKKMLFSNINLSMKVPDIIALHGPHNSGKATLLRLIAGASEPTEGEILVDGIKSSSLISEDLVNHVGLIVAQNPMFQGTIMNNLTAFNEEKEDAAMELVRLLALDKEIALLPHGYETKINDGFADTIAPGIKQRIAVVRVLLNKPKIILFNNADNGLDREGYNHLIKLLTLLKGKVSMIITTDDHNISKLADRHFTLKDGALTETKLSKDSSIFELKPYKELKI